jgi:hypothetical protein
VYFSIFPFHKQNKKQTKPKKKNKNKNKNKKMIKKYRGIKECRLVHDEEYDIIKNVILTKDKEQTFKKLMADAYSYVISLDLSVEEFNIIKEVVFFNFNDKNTMFKVTMGLLIT